MPATKKPPQLSEVQKRVLDWLFRKQYCLPCALTQPKPIDPAEAHRLRRNWLDMQRERQQQGKPLFMPPLKSEVHWRAADYLGRPASPSEVASLSRTLARLESRRLIRRVDGTRGEGKKRRTRRVKLTVKGIMLADDNYFTFPTVNMSETGG